MSGKPPPGSSAPAAPATPKPGQWIAMISSTALDLPEHRRAVMDACLAADVFPKAMEHLPARDASGVKVSLEMVDQAQIYIGIYAWRYGWIPKGGKVSITEMEFDHALERQASGKLQQILIFTAHETQPFTRKDIETGKTAERKLEAFKARASDGRVRKEFRSVDDLKQLVTQALATFLADHPAAPDPHAKVRFPARKAAKRAKDPKPAPLKSAIPNNLPGLQPFFGREDELKVIADALDPDSRTWGALIDGPGGMGKTSLAVKAAYAVTPQQFQRIIFISLKTRELDDDGIRDLSGYTLSGIVELFSELARELGKPEILKEAEGKRPRLLLDALRGTGTLLVLDNLESLTVPQRGEVLTFVKKLPQGCKAILTSRGRIGSGAEELILGRLSQEAALQTLAELATHNPVLAETNETQRIALYEHTAGKPLLLRWTAGQLGRGHCLTTADAIAHLLSCPKNNDPLEFIFGDLVEDLSAEEVKIIAALTYFTLPAKVKHIATVAGLDDENACLLACKSLANRSLAVPSEEAQAFALVPMVADFLRQHRPEVVAETGDRLEKYAYAMIVENGYKNYERFPAMDAAWESVSPALPLFFKREGETLQELRKALMDFLEFTGRWDELLVLCQKAEAAAATVGDHMNAGWSADCSGWIHHMRGQVEEVLACAERAAAHWQQPASGAGDHERASAIRLRGLGHRRKGAYTSAIAAFDEALDLWRALRPQGVEVAMVLNDLAGMKRLSEQYDEAERDYRKALRIARELEDAECVAIYTGNLAILALDRKQWPEAEVLAREALALSEQVGRLEQIAMNCNRLAYSLVRQGKAAAGLPHAGRAVEIFTKLGSPELKSALATLRKCEEGVG